MTKIVKLVLCLSGGTLLGILGWSAVAQAQTGTFSVSATSGAPGSTITVTSVTPCTLPPGVTGAPFARISLTRGSTTLASGEFAASASGAWQGTLTVSTTAAAGSAELSGSCIASPQAEGSLLTYVPVTFTVTGPSVLARTASSSAALAIYGLGFVLLGLGLTAIGSRRALGAVVTVVGDATCDAHCRDRLSGGG